MARFDESTFANWTRPPSDSEETKLANAERMVRDALNADPKIKTFTKKIFGQGSYANDTNVRLNSDIDINVCYENGFYFDLPQNKTRDDFGITPVPYSFAV